MSLNRRNLLGYGGASLVSGSLLSPWCSVSQAAEKSQEDFDDYKAIVYLLFSGGMDSFNLLVPYDANEYERYAEIRTDLAIQREDLLPLDTTYTDRPFAVPVTTPEIRDLFNDGDLAFLANVGPLTQHMNREQYLDETLARPLNLESHSDQIAQWQSTNALTVLSQQTTGWIGRLADRFGSTMSNGLSMNVSMAGFNLVQTGESGTPILVPRHGDGEPFSSLEVGDQVKETMNDDFEFGRVRAQYSNLLQKEYLNRLQRSIEDARKANRDFRGGFQGFDTLFNRTPDERGHLTGFEASMKRVVEFISAHIDFGGGATRQTFYVEYGGWDHHENLHGNFDWRIRDVSFGLKAFRDALVEIGLLDSVVLLTASDFGRTMTSNGGGSDHAWGGNAMVLGGNVQGGRVLGEYPEMDLKGTQISNDDRGNFIPTTSLEEYFSEIALWFGLDEEDLGLILPNVSSFIPQGSTRPRNVGVLS